MSGRRDKEMETGVDGGEGVRGAMMVVARYGMHIPGGGRGEA